MCIIITKSAEMTSNHCNCATCHHGHRLALLPHYNDLRPLYFVPCCLFGSAFKFQAAYTIVDQMHEEFPELVKDQYWEEVVPKELPYTLASECYRRAEPSGSADHYKVKEADAIYSNLLAPGLHHRKIPHLEDVYGEHPDLDYVSKLNDSRRPFIMNDFHRRLSTLQWSAARTGFSGKLIEWDRFGRRRLDTHQEGSLTVRGIILCTPVRKPVYRCPIQFR